LEGRRYAVIAIKRAFNWAEGEGLLAVNPLHKVRKPPQTYRERVLTRDERQEDMAAIRDQAFRDFVFAMQETGCRPSEVSRGSPRDEAPGRRRPRPALRASSRQRAR
jgi:integrase